MSVNPAAVHRCEIHPTLGIARVGNSPDEYFIGPETPGEPSDPEGRFKDAKGRVKRQAARFRIYAYDEAGKVLGELTADQAEITWSAELANAKGAWFKFLGRYRDNPSNRADERRPGNDETPNRVPVPPAMPTLVEVGTQPPVIGADNPNNLRNADIKNDKDS
ncbi:MULTISPECIES: LodA/GoxA family CTQ-dependent oxidase [unclassified Streptomyces]|uniref:LodA/GoxA family CTQ-dependent oxidase n=1 Tax=unclassified Streptomyces TaxID=2593676 RepID=UPI002E254CE5|nr:LodA/GoxA family CTQ-dependent oxidase [Streptomyces sp. NBC_01001]